MKFKLSLLGVILLTLIFWTIYVSAGLVGETTPAKTPMGGILKFALYEGFDIHNWVPRNYVGIRPLRIFRIR